MRFLCVFALVMALLSPMQSATEEGDETTPAPLRVSEVVAGDTIIIADIGTVGYLGIDAPDPKKGDRPAQPFAKEAIDLNKTLVSDKSITLEAVQDKKDQLGRTLAFVILDDGKCVNEEIVKQGLARVMGDLPEGPRRDALLKAEKDARAKKLGIWSVAEDAVSVYATKNGEAYHLSTCQLIDIGKAEKIGVEEAKKRELRACLICRPDVPSLEGGDHPDTVYITKNGTRYHRKDCVHLRKSQITISREEAIRRGYKPCKTCKP